MSEELKPCPFCGGNASIYEYQDERDGDRFWVFQIACDKCSAEMEHVYDKEEAIAAWNRRDYEIRRWVGINGGMPQIVFTPNETRVDGKPVKWDDGGEVQGSGYAELFGNSEELKAKIQHYIKWIEEQKDGGGYLNPMYRSQIDAFEIVLDWMDELSLKKEASA